MEVLKEKKRKRMWGLMEIPVELKIDFWKNWLIDLEIPITIYTPLDVNKDKIVVFFHGGGNKKFFSVW